MDNDLNKLLNVAVVDENLIGRVALCRHKNPGVITSVKDGLCRGKNVFDNTRWQTRYPILVANSVEEYMMHHVQAPVEEPIQESTL